MVCRSCGVEVAPEARFCPNCGSSQSSADEERRVVTAVFADIVGFTALAEHRDPEEVKRLVDASFTQLADDITAFGGVVDKVVGDQIVALFGAPVAHEDDAERAVRASLRMQSTLRGLGSNLDPSVAIRIGVNTGEVLVGSTTAGGDYTAMGDVMNSAARLQELASPGQVLVGAPTRQATGDAVRYEHVGRLPARGREDPIEAWAAEEAVRPPGAHRRRAEVFVGRERELDFLRSQAVMAVDLHTAQLSIVLGEAGMGKTRLIQEASDRLSAEYEVLVVEGRCVPYGEANVWWPIAELLRHLYNLGLELDRVETERRLRAALVDRFGSAATDLTRWLAALMHALGFETMLRGGDRGRNRSEVMLATTQVFAHELRSRAVVVVLSDMHWAADAVWELIDHLLVELSKSPLIVMMSARTLDRNEVLGRHGTSVLQLGPLHPEASIRLLGEVWPSLPEESADQLVTRSGGNPYFLEELAGLVAEDLEGLPDTLRGLVAARLDSLPAAQRALIEDASVLGRSGSVDGLKTLAVQSRSADTVDDALAGLVADDLLEVDGPRYEFLSDLVRDVAYGTLTKTVRAQRHLGIAQYLESIQSGPLRNSVVVAIADHYRSAAQLVTELSVVADVDGEEVTRQALSWLDQAGYRAIAVGELSQAERWFDHGLALAPDDESSVGFLYGRAKVRSELRDVTGARADLDRLEPLIVSDPTMSAKALLVRGDTHRVTGDLERAAGELREAADRLAALGVADEQALALRLLGMTETARYDDSLARQALESSRMVAAKASDHRNEAWAIQTMAWQAFVRGRVDEAHELATQAIEIFAELGDRSGLAWAQGVRAWVAFHLGQWDTAQELVDSVLPEARRHGDPWAESIMLYLSGSLRLWSGQAREAQSLAQAASDRAEDVNLAASSLALEGRALVSLGRVAEGTALLERSFVMADRAGDRDTRRIAVVANCASAARLGEPERAIRWAARFETIPVRSGPGSIDYAGHTLGETDLTASLALALLQRGAVEEAVSQLALAESSPDDEVRVGPYAGSAIAGRGSGVGHYTGAVETLAAAAQGDTEAVERKVRSVLVGTSTYLDRVLALSARAAVRLQRGDRAGCDAALRAARAEVDATDDQTTQLLLDLCAAVFGFGDLAHAEQRMRGSGLDPTGWRTIWETAARTSIVQH